MRCASGSLPVTVRDGAALYSLWLLPARRDHYASPLNFTSSALHTFFFPRRFNSCKDIGSVLCNLEMHQLTRKNLGSSTNVFSSSKLLPSLPFYFYKIQLKTNHFSGLKLDQDKRFVKKTDATMHKHTEQTCRDVFKKRQRLSDVNSNHIDSSPHFSLSQSLCFMFLRFLSSSLGHWPCPPR